MTEGERAVLRDKSISHDAKLLYILGFRDHMDYKTGETFISRPRLIDIIEYIPPARSSKAPKRHTLKEVDKMIERLIAVGLLVKTGLGDITKGTSATYFLPLAYTDLSQKRQGHDKTPEFKGLEVSTGGEQGHDRGTVSSSQQGDGQTQAPQGVEASQGHDRGTVQDPRHGDISVISVKDQEINRLEDQKSKKPVARFQPPTEIEVYEYMLTKGHDSRIEATKFWNYYESNGWKVGKNKMKSWHAAASGWLSRNLPKTTGGQTYGKPTNSTANLLHFAKTYGAK